MHVIEQELQKATGVKPTKDEPRQDYLRRIVKEIPEDDAWDELPLEVQEFANKMIKAENTDQEIPDFPAEKEEEVMESTAVNGTGTPARKPKKAAPKPDTTKKKVAAKKAAPAKDAKSAKRPAAKAKEAKEPKVRAVREDGVKYRIKKLMVKDPSISVEDIEAALRKDGDKPSKFTVTAIRSEFRHSLHVLRDLGWPKPNV